MDRCIRDKLFRSAKVFCNVEFLATFQNSPWRPFADSKSLVDLTLRKDPEEVLKLLSIFPRNPSHVEFNGFMKIIFDDLNCFDKLLRQTVPSDYNTELPPFLEALPHPHESLISFVSDLKLRWSELCREFVGSSDPARVSTRSSLIPLPHPFFIPGGRFRECYYWDTLWVVKGLVASGMVESAKGAVRNLVYLVEQIGFVPNGNRVYYLNRSQPPIMTLAAKVVFDALEMTADQIPWLQEVLSSLEKEYQWFRKHRSVPSFAGDGTSYEPILSHYNVDTQEPRPESFKEDTATCTKTFTSPWKGTSPKRTAASIYKNIASGAESGWDFSSRWLSEDECNGLGTIETCGIIPCCLNGILLKVERTLAMFHRVLYDDSNKLQRQGRRVADSHGCEGHLEGFQKYSRLAQERQVCIQKFLWNGEKKFWFDYNMAKQSQTKIASCAGLFPLWAECWDSSLGEVEATALVDYVLSSSGLLYAGGLACTAKVSPEQWDFPNLWPPLVDIAVDGLQHLGKLFPSSGAGKAAETVALRFIYSAYQGWLKDRTMHEKYNCTKDNGCRGQGGEYIPQTGFGWTNGTILWLLQEYSAALNARL